MKREERLHRNGVLTMNLLQMVVKRFRSERRRGDSIVVPRLDNCHGKLELRGGWLVEGRPQRSNSWYTDEKRSFRRYRDGQRVPCYSASSEFLNAQVIDASLGGLRIKTDALLAIDSCLSVVLKFGEEIGLFFVRILWQGKRQDSYEYGVQFSKMDQKRDSPLRRYIAHLKSCL
jgi:hypothetical protein